jgi:hypothetical protein
LRWSVATYSFVTLITWTLHVFLECGLYYKRFSWFSFWIFGLWDMLIGYNFLEWFSFQVVLLGVLIEPGTC